MKRINLFAMATIISVALVSCGGSAEPKTETKKVAEDATVEVINLNVNTAESSVMWSGSVLGMHSHAGTVSITEGSLEMTGKAVSGGMFTIDMKSIHPTDSAYTEEKTPDMLVGHLSSADFFLVDSFPTASFIIKSADMANNSITGDLTVRGTTNEEVIENVQVNTDSGEASGNITFDRQKYGVAFSHPMKDVVISDDIVLKIKLKF